MRSVLLLLLAGCGGSVAELPAGPEDASLDVATDAANDAPAREASPDAGNDAGCLASGAACVVGDEPCCSGLVCSDGCHPPPDASACVRLGGACGDAGACCSGLGCANDSTCHARPVFDAASD